MKRGSPDSGLAEDAEEDEEAEEEEEDDAISAGGSFASQGAMDESDGDMQR